MSTGITDAKKITCIFLTNVRCDEQNRDQLEQGDKEIGKAKVNYKICDISEIKKEYREVEDLEKGVPELIKIPIHKKRVKLTDEKEFSYIDVSNIVDSDSKYKSIICTMKGTVLQNIYKEHTNRLFHYNIREYLGENVINKGIIETIRTEPENFYYYNNGISCICSSMELVENKDSAVLKVKDFQIINGAQTTTCIGKFPDPLLLSQVQVLLRITKTEDIKKQKGLNKSIVKYNNSQTVIKDSDFRSNDEIQNFLEKTLKQYKYEYGTPARSIVYLKKRRKYSGKKNELVVKIENFIKEYYAFKFNPIDFQTQPRSLFDIESGGLYYKIFGEGGEEVSEFPKNRVEEIVATIFICKRITDLLKDIQSDLKSKNKKESSEYQATLAK